MPYMTFEDYVRFTGQIGNLVDRNTGARAVLRRGLGQDMERQPHSHGIVVPLIPDSANATDRRVCFALANYIATAHPVPAANKANLGDAVRRIDDKRRTKADDPASTLENTLIAMSRQHNLDKVLTQHLPRLITRIRASRNAPGVTAPDWARLGKDLASWSRHRRDITSRWLTTYHTTKSASGSDSGTPE